MSDEKGPATSAGLFVSEMADTLDPTDLDALIERVDPDRWLSSRFIANPRARADVVTLYAYDHELARAPRAASNPLIAEIRLAWWREVLEEIYGGLPVRHHPTAQSLAELVGRRDLPLAPLEAMIDGRYRLLDPEPLTQDETLALGRDTAGAASQVAALILDPGTDHAAAAVAGSAWGVAWLIKEGRGKGVTLDLSRARSAARRLSVAAFPAVLHSALASRRARGGTISDLESRARLTWSSATGRI